MKTRILLVLTLGFLLAGAWPLAAQTLYWNDGIPTDRYEAPATRVRTMRVAIPELRGVLEAASRGSAQELSLPLPDGSEIAVSLERVSILVPALQAANPGIRTFRGNSPDNRYHARVTIAEDGVWARIERLDGQRTYIQPLAPGKASWSIVYDAKDAVETRFPCGVAADDAATEDILGNKTAAYNYTDANLRNYRLCVVATGEYTVWAGGGVASQSAALAYITASVNNISDVFERDMGITFTLNSPNSILYTDSTTDPFNRAASSANLTACSTALATNIGNGNYDIGHLFSAGFGGGLASVGAVCGSSKGQGESGASSPTGSYFENVVMHEMGHQFGAPHSFSANTGGCNGNGSYSSGWEPGSGNTIMSYSGLCSPNNSPGGRADSYHAGSLSQMSTYVLIGTGSTCPTNSHTANPAPTISTATSVTVPHSTPFKLTSVSTDANNTALTYTYDQLDAIGGTTGASTPPASTNTTGPMFKSYFPSAAATRYFPNLADLFDGNATPFEVLPSVSRSMNFRATVRDNNPGFGRTATESVVVSTSTCGPFSITSQGSATSLTANGSNTITVTWNTASACVTCANVNLLYTRDHGATFTTLLAGTSNDGTETFIVPNIPSCDGRLYLECASAPFFDVTSAPITIGSACTAAGASFSPSTPLSAQAGTAALNQSLAPQYGTLISSPITGTLSLTDPASTLTLLNTTNSSCANFGNDTRDETVTFQPGSTTTYTFTGNASRIYNLYDGAYDPNDPCQNWIASSATFNGSTYSTGTAVSAALCKDRSYTLVISMTIGSLPTSYSIAITGGSIYTGEAAPGAGVSYSYVIVNNTSGNIVSIQSSGDMTNPALFPTGTYTIYGVSSSSSATTLQTTYGGTSFSAFRAAALNQTSGLCASLSFNSRAVTVTANPLPLTDIRFEAALTAPRAARSAWTVTAGTENIQYFQLDRSYDGNSFTSVTQQNLRQASHYEFLDAGLRDDAAGVYYRLQTRKKGGDVMYSPTAYLKFAATATSPSIAVAPNPVLNGVVRAQVGLPMAGVYQMTVTDATGRAVSGTGISLDARMQTVEIPVNGMSSGVYLLRINGGGISMQTRFVIGGF